MGNQSINASVKVLLFYKLSLIFCLFTLLILLLKWEPVSLIFVILAMGQLLILKKFFTSLELLQESINLKYKYFSQKLKNYGENHNPQDALMLIGCRYDLERTHRMDKSLMKFSNTIIQSFYAFTFMVSVFNAYILASVLTVDYYSVKMAHIPVYTTLISLTYILIVYYLSTKFVGYNKILANNQN